jgi:hypothetical protein
MPENPIFTPTALNQLAAQFSGLDPNNHMDITQLAIALKHHIIPTLQSHAKAQSALDQIKALVDDPVTRPTSTVVDIRNTLNNDTMSSSEKLERIKRVSCDALDSPPSFKILFITIRPTHQDSTDLYLKIYALASDGEPWCPKKIAVASQNNDDQRLPIL